MTMSGGALARLYFFALVLLFFPGNRAADAQDANLPPAYPRPGATVLLENGRVIVWDIAWLKQEYPLHRHRYDLAGVYYEPGDRIIISTDSTRRPVSTKAWDTAFQRSGVTHIEQGASESPLRAVFIEMKEPGPSGRLDPGRSPAAVAGSLGAPFVDNDRTSGWLMTVAAAATEHRHARDAVVIAFAAGKPTATFVTAGTVHAQDAPAGAERVYLFELK